MKKHRRVGDFLKPKYEVIVLLEGTGQQYSPFKISKDTFSEYVRIGTIKQQKIIMSNTKNKIKFRNKLKKLLDI